jgi:hypothetical protein
MLAGDVNWRVLEPLAGAPVKIRVDSMERIWRDIDFVAFVDPPTQNDRNWLFGGV